jgi:hypothetical protein
MTLVAPPDGELEHGLEAVDPEGGGGDGGPSEPGARVVRGTDASISEEEPASVLLTSAAAFLASAAAGWMCAGIFRGGFPRMIGLLGPIIGVGTIALSYRTKRPSFVQYLAVPIAVVVGALLVLPDAQGGSANLPGLVAEAIRSGGIGQPPVPFDPGWRFLLLLLITVVSAGSTSLALGLNKPKMAVLLPVPVIFGAALLQPPGATFVSIVVALVLAIGAMSVAFGGDLAKERTTSGAFEVRRLGRGAGILVALVAALIGLSQLGFLFPDSSADQVIPPKRPEVPPRPVDRVLFTVKLDQQVPIRLGVLDVYDKTAWLTPPFDSGRLALIPKSGLTPFKGKDGSGEGSTVLAPPIASKDQRVRATFTVQDVEGHVIPTLANPLVTKAGFKIEYDPRTQAYRVPDSRPRKGQTYTIEAAGYPTADELMHAPKPGPELREFLEAPAPPPAKIQELLDRAPTTNAFDRLQFVRAQFYTNVVAAGAGNPKDVSPQRVVQLLEGKEASPFEITAAEVLLARYAGIPARFGYGYYGGDKPADSDVYSIRPKHGATWLEAYFQGHGWVPIVGKPPKAKSSLRPADKKNDPTIRPTDELALIVYVPIRLQSIRLLYVLVRYWLYRALPVGLLGLLVLLLYPGLVKMARRLLRRRWAAGYGLPERMAVAYAELRDTCNDFNLGDPMHTPLEFLTDLAPDAEHAELAWVVSRGLWGDLRRDLRPEDVEAAEDMAASVAKRLRRANSGLPRIIAFGSRASLRDPYTREIPNLWPRRTVRSMVRGRWRGVIHWRGRRPARIPAPTAMLLLVVAFGLTLGSCAQTTDMSGRGRSAFPRDAVPGSALSYQMVRESKAESAFARAGQAALVSEGQVFSIHQGSTIQGSIQVAAFKPGLKSRQRDVREGVLDTIGGGRFELTRLGDERVYVLRLPEQSMLLWFPPSGLYYNLMVARQGFGDADRVFASVIAHQKGETVVDLSRTAPLDPRRGVEE